MLIRAYTVTEVKNTSKLKIIIICSHFNKLGKNKIIKKIILLVRVKRHTKIKKKQRLGWYMPSQHKNGSSMLYYQSVY